ncbi:MAG: penicillin-binding protein 2 [Gemmatimonadaceae bacterium]
MSFHPNDVARRARTASIALAVVFVLLLSAFFRTQVLENSRYSMQSEENRLREVPLPAPRGIIYDRNNDVIAENVPGYSVLMLSPGADSLRASLARLSALVPLTPEQVESAVRRWGRSKLRPTVILSDARFDVVSVLEEHRVEFPGLIIQSAPKRYYPDGAVVAPIVGYVGEINEADLGKTAYRSYKAGQQIGKGGLEQQYEKELHGLEGSRFVEVDARGRVVREAGARPDIPPGEPAPLRTNIDLDLQRFTAGIFGDSLQGGAIAIEPKTGAVLALYSAPSFDPNRFIGGIAPEFWQQLTTDPRKPLLNKVIQGRYPPGSTFKLATAVTALQEHIATLNDKMPEPCTGGYWYGRYFKCWEHKGHGAITLARAIAVSCDVYFYQLGLKIGISRLVAGGASLNFRKKTGIDLPEEKTPEYENQLAYSTKTFGARGFSGGETLNLAIGQGANAQTVVNMARFYTALATDGQQAKPQIVKRAPERTTIFSLTPEQMTGVRAALAGVVGEGGTAASAQIQGMVLAGKTGSAQNSQDPKNDHSWFVGFAPESDPKIVVAVMIEFGGHGARAARIAAKIIEHFLKVAPTQLLSTEG